jgi:hypothetical protein
VRAENLLTADPRFPPDAVRDETIVRWAPFVRRALHERG